VWDFHRHTSVVMLRDEDLRHMAPAIATLARAEGLEGHARAAELRMRMLSEAAGKAGKQ
jgi:histidinol dehydrogenase